MTEGATYPMTPEQFDKLVALIEAAAHRAVINEHSGHPTIISNAANNFDRKKKAARDALVEPS